MSIKITTHGHAKAIRLKTGFADALLIPATRTRDDDRKFDEEFNRASAVYLQQGYCPEDAATLGLMALSGLGFHHPDAVPRLIDQELGMAEQERRLSGLAFPALSDAHPGIYPIVDDLRMLDALLAAGANIIQLRVKAVQLDLTLDRLIGQACRLAEQAKQCQLFINDHWQSAIHHGAYGVHLGQEDLLSADLAAIADQGLRLGVSSHAFWEVARALTISPSYIACGPIFPTRVKAMPWIAQGIGNLGYWTQLIAQPVVAIGGISEENLEQVRNTGCAAASVINAIVSSPDPSKEFRRLQDRWMSLSAKNPANDLCPIARPTLPAEPQPIAVA